MRKHLLFAAMLTLGAAPVVASNAMVTVQTVASDDAEVTVDEAYEALQKAIETAITKIDETYAIIETKFPDSYVLESLKYNKELIQSIATEAASKKEAGTLTVEDVQSYQTQVEEYAQVIEGAVEQATQEEYQALVSQHYMAANDSVNKAMEMPETVANYYYSSIDALYEAMNTIYINSFNASTAEEYQAICDDFDAVATKAHDLAVTIAAADALVEDILKTLNNLDTEIAKVKEDFPEYDLSYTEEAETYWKDFVAEFGAAPADEENIYGAEQIEQYTMQFGWFLEEVGNIYNTAMMDDYLAKFAEKYTPASNKIFSYQENLYDECPNVMEEYYNKFDDLGVELRKLYDGLYFAETMTDDEFAEILKQVQEISEKADKLYQEALDAEKVATGINGVSADNTSSAKVFTLDGKAVKSTNGKKGAYIINGKKVILK